MNEKIRKMMREIERRGGQVHINASMPNAIAEQFLEQSPPML